jgi:hypothetical protein
VALRACERGEEGNRARGRQQQASTPGERAGAKGGWDGRSSGVRVREGRET